MGERVVPEVPARPQELFDEQDARRAIRALEFVAGLCERLLVESA